MGACTGYKVRSSSVVGWIKFAILAIIFSLIIQGAICAIEPTESECRPYIEKALKEQHPEGADIQGEKSETANFLKDKEESNEIEETKDGDESTEDIDKKSRENVDDADDADVKNENEDDGEDKTEEADTEEEIDDREHKEQDADSSENADAVDQSKENTDEQNDDNDNDHDEEDEDDDNDDDNQKNGETVAQDKTDEDDDDDSLERPIEIEVQEIQIDDDDDDNDDDDNANDSIDKGDADDKKAEDDNKKSKVESIASGETKEDTREQDDKTSDEKNEADENAVDEKDKNDKSQEAEEEAAVSEEDTSEKVPITKKIEKTEAKTSETIPVGESQESKDTTPSDEQTGAPEEEELTQEMVIPENLRPRDHIDQILRLDEDSGLEKILEKTIDSTLKSLKGLYDNAIKPLEMLYKYRDLSNRHFGDPEIFSKPLILFMGPWSGGKSSTINYLLNNEFNPTALRTGAEPSPAYFNILMYGEEEEILDGTQLAADWTFSGLQKFGQGLLDRLKGVKLPNKLLEKVNVVEIPGILEIRKQVQRLFPFNDACQWFIDRADIIFLVYDPSKLDVGPETEAILDQLKGRESQTRIILNKADQVKPEELMRVQGTLIWNISPLMSSTEPPIMYSTSLWSMPYEVGAPTRLLLAQERAFLKDLRDAIDKRVENKISSARRFAVRVRNHAKMVDCYLTTYYNHKSFFGNRKRISDDIIEHPQKYHIYEGLSTLTNISRYDLPDPDVYQDFFKINPLYEFKKLSETCTYFRGCPINKLDVVIAYDLPELVGKYRKAVEAAKEQLHKRNS